MVCAAIELFALAAKPVADIQVGVADLDDEDRYVPPCEAGRLWADQAAACTEANSRFVLGLLS
jgi:hypothetical protein